MDLFKAAQLVIDGVNKDRARTLAAWFLVPVCHLCSAAA